MHTTTPRTVTGLIGLRLNVDGTMEDVRITVDPDGTHVSSLNAAIGSDLFDVVGLPNGIDVFVDDEGLYRAEHSRSCPKRCAASGTTRRATTSTAQACSSPWTTTATRCP